MKPERLLNVRPEVILGSLTAGYVISDNCQTSRLHNTGTTPNLGAPLDTNQHELQNTTINTKRQTRFRNTVIKAKCDVCSGWGSGSQCYDKPGISPRQNIFLWRFKRDRSPVAGHVKRSHRFSNDSFRPTLSPPTSWAVSPTYMINQFADILSGRQCLKSDREHLKQTRHLLCTGYRHLFRAGILGTGEQYEPSVRSVSGWVFFSAEKNLWLEEFCFKLGLILEQWKWMWS